MPSELVKTRQTDDDEAPGFANRLAASAIRRVWARVEKKIFTPEFALMIIQIACPPLVPVIGFVRSLQHGVSVMRMFNEAALYLQRYAFVMMVWVLTATHFFATPPVMFSVQLLCLLFAAVASVNDAFTRSIPFLAFSWRDSDKRQQRLSRASATAAHETEAGAATYAAVYAMAVAIGCTAAGFMWVNGATGSAVMSWQSVPWPTALVAGVGGLLCGGLALCLLSASSTLLSVRAWRLAALMCFAIAYSGPIDGVALAAAFLWHCVRCLLLRYREPVGHHDGAEGHKKPIVVAAAAWKRATDAAPTLVSVAVILPRLLIHVTPAVGAFAVALLIFTELVTSPEALALGAIDRRVAELKKQPKVGESVFAATVVRLIVAAATVYSSPPWIALCLSLVWITVDLLRSLLL